MTANLVGIDHTYILSNMPTVKIIITQRMDGPFGDDTPGGNGRYYIAIHRYVNPGVWQHVHGSTRNANSMTQAMIIKNELVKEYE